MDLRRQMVSEGRNGNLLETFVFKAEREPRLRVVAMAGEGGSEGSAQLQAFRRGEQPRPRRRPRQSLCWEMRSRVSGLCPLGLSGCKPIRVIWALSLYCLYTQLLRIILLRASITKSQPGGKVDLLCQVLRGEGI